MLIADHFKIQNIFCLGHFFCHFTISAKISRNFFSIYLSMIMPSGPFSWLSKISIPKAIKRYGKQNFMSVSRGTLSFPLQWKVYFVLNGVMQRDDLTIQGQICRMFFTYLNIARLFAVPLLKPFCAVLHGCSTLQ